MDSIQTPARKSLRQIWGTIAQIGAHLSMTLLLASLIAWAIVPMNSLQVLFDYSARVPDIRNMNITQLLIQFGLAACIWAMCVIFYKLVALHRAAPAAQRLRVARGTILTEFLIILPVFLLLTFGMAQLAINNMAGMLANVAVYEAARAVWIWQPEVDSERVEADPVDRARIAAAQVMTPVAPGNFTIIPTGLSDEFKASRKALILSQIPLGGSLPSGLSDLGIGLGSINLQAATEKNFSMAKALDKSTFLLRSVSKYTHAYLATDIEIINGDDIGATLSYQHNQTMPLVGYIFGKKSSGVAGVSLNAPGMRSGYYSTFKRSYALKAQALLPNKTMPNDDVFKEYDGDDKPADAKVTEQIQEGAGGSW